MSVNSNNLIVIENGQLTEYRLDNRNAWEIGRISKGNTPDIGLHAATVSRKHGRFTNMGGFWYYLDYNSKNGTVYKDRRIKPGLNNRIRPVRLDDGDVLIFGGGETAVVDARTIWGMYVKEEFDGHWRTVDSKGYTNMKFMSGDGETTVRNPQRGTVIKKEDGIAIYMGDLTYLTGKMEMSGEYA
jgi:pSer/pThr/pTyr-binding forkhead associated (FHA) protein